MLPLGEYLSEQYAIQISERRKQMLGEGLETTPAELRYDLFAINPKSLTARIVSDTDEEVVLSLILKKSKESMA